MRPHLIFVALVALLLGGCATTANRTKSAKAEKPGSRLTVRTTAYTHTEAGGRNNAIGGRLRFGGDTYSAASDWSWLPLGTRFRMVSNGRTYVIEDYGSALVGRKTVDLYMPNRRTMNAWGVRNVEIEILEWGSKAMSLKLLEPRQRNSHVRRMVYALKNGQSKKPQG
jgi:3D (Asp-Asp-Asp) domain-containing protein